MSRNELLGKMCPLGVDFDLLPRCMYAGDGSSAVCIVSLHYISYLLQLAHLSNFSSFLHKISSTIESLHRRVTINFSTRIVNNGFTNTKQKGQPCGSLEVPCSMHAHVHVPVPIWSRLRYHWQSSGNEGILGGMFYYHKRTASYSNHCQVFGHEDPLSPTGWNISPGRQQLISSLMILGAFLASSAAGMHCLRFYFEQRIHLTYD
jgi:hypothetical protein